LRRREAFFFEKKNQETFATLSPTHRRLGDSIAKVFASFFKKKRFPFPWSFR